MTDRCQPAEELRGEDGWYWVQCKMSEPFPSWWFGGGQDWLCNGRYNFASSLMHADGWRCLGPCATPAEVDALRAERDAMEQKMLHEHQSAVDQFGIAEVLRARVAELETESTILKGWLVRAGDMLNEAAGDGIDWSQIGDPADWVLDVDQHFGVDDWSLSRAALKGAKP